MAHVPVGLIAAVAENGVIGAAGSIPWRLSTDMRRFKQLTTGKPLIMGRKTAQSLASPLSDRTNIVLSSRELAEAGFIRVTSVDEAFAVAEEDATVTGADEIMIIGGGEIYAATLPRANRLYITQVAASPEGDTHFPDVDWSEWREVSREAVPAGERDSHASTFIIFERTRASDA